MEEIKDSDLIQYYIDLVAQLTHDKALLAIENKILISKLDREKLSKEDCKEE